MNFRPPTDGRWAMTPRTFQVGDTTLLDTDPNPWTVKAVTANFAALTRPVTDADRREHEEQYEELYGNLDHYEGLYGEVFYTVLDWRNGLRGPCNLIGQSYGSGDYTEAECAAMLEEFEAGELEISYRNWERIRFAEKAGAMTATTLTLRTVLDAIPDAGGTSAEIAAFLGVPDQGPTVRAHLDHLLLGDLTLRQSGARYRSTARARRMVGATAEELAAWVSSRLSSASPLPGGGSR